MGLSKIIKEFEKGTVCVVGLRGCGKDMLFANVIARRKQPYVSNSDYHCDKSPFIKLKFDRLNVKNNYKNFISDDIVPYDYPYGEGFDIYISDCGIFLPSQYCNELNKLYPEFPTFYALSRHIANNNVHFNVQNLNRVWDKLREQSDTYIMCNSCHVFKGRIPIIGRLFKGLVFQVVTVYEKYQSCVDRVEPYKPISIPIMASKQTKASLKQVNEERRGRYRETYGKVKRRLLIYRNKSKYDTRLFKGVLSREE